MKCVAFNRLSEFYLPIHEKSCVQLIFFF